MWLCSRINHINVLYMGSITNTQSHTQHIYMIGQEHNHIVFPDYISISHCKVKNFPNSNLMIDSHPPTASSDEKEVQKL